MKISLVLLFIVLSACSSKPAPEKSAPAEDVFGSRALDGCFLIYNMKTAKLEAQTGSICDARYPASSTFKVPLSVMAFDAGVLKSESQVYKWDGKKGMMDNWNRDHDARSWMRDSVVWFSQRLTPKLGQKKLQGYLDAFAYGNRNLSGGLTEAWLMNAANPEKALSISPREQLELMRKLFSGTLPASKRSQEITRKIMFIETLPDGFDLHGKTGSNFFETRDRQLGWFLGHFSRGTEEYVTVTLIADQKKFQGTGFGGFRARELTKTLFAEFIAQKK